MVRFCDKEVYAITLDEFSQKTKGQIMAHFYENDGECEDSVIFIYDNNNQYYGMTDYQTILLESDYIIKDYLTISENFWDDAKDFFFNNPNIEVPVFNSDKQPLGFCYSDNNSYETYEMILGVFEKFCKNIPSPLPDMRKGTKLICINDLNELAWRVYQLFIKCGYPVCVIGEQWEWFGVTTMEGYNTCPSYAKMYLYSEGRGHFRQKGMRDAVNLAAEFNWLISWIYKNESILYAYEIDKLLQKGIAVCKVIIPDMSKLDKNAFTKMDLFNQLSPIPVGKISSNESIRSRQRDYLGEEEYEVKERTGKSILSDYGWNAVAYGELKTEKLDGISFNKRVYLVGPCIVASYDSLTENSLVARLQELVSKHGYEVVRVQCPDLRMDLICEMENIPIKKNDIVIVINGDGVLKKEHNCFELDLSELYSKQRSETWFKDRVSRHVNSAANKAIAQEIYNKYLETKVFGNDNEENNTYLQKGEILSEELQKEIFVYTDSVRVELKKLVDKSVNGDELGGRVCGERIGAIVMNCNPFTNGHLYLIEQASSKVDYLYIFVVQEDKSFFAFDDRFELVKAGTAHLDNVIVVPSGEHVLSYKTLPIYFEKEEQKTAKVDATHDVEIFARYIAPRLGITCRFVGEEPIDMVTKQYNEQMASILPEFGIEFIEIPRKATASDNEVISASRVRRLMKEEKWEEIRELVPETTYEYLIGS